ncbi:PR5-like receptor kinase [Aristolochia californica]|uniref:PR5-like receptor kinase n=1 Tax=Aristolochia californica TaxID=171875 RepID=UPI0035DF889F
MRKGKWMLNPQLAYPTMIEASFFYHQDPFCGEEYFRPVRHRLTTGQKCIDGFNYNQQLTQNFRSETAAGTQPTLSVTIGLLVAGAIIGILLYIYRRKLPSPRRLLFWRKQQDVEPVEEFMENYQYSLGPKRYKYSELKKMTNRFTDKLGEGGYGGVFQGKLPDGRLVAVKLLKESKGNGEEFINEVNSIGRTAHVNIVSLVGFCFQGSKRALIYEFMPNGSLEKFIYGEKPDHLGWRKLYEIALGIARGLDYLHRGCTIRILHFDIKPHNILLDQDFCPKISDFGLAKLSSRKDSVISMGGARGTLGYIAPELLYGRVSYKSDVYSYGMMVLEMVGGRKNFDNKAENTSQIYFPSLIYSRLEEQRDLELEGVVTEEDEKIARKMIIVGLWCTQMDPASRPSMDKVLEMLEGNGEAMQMPPRPPLSSPARSFDSPSSTEETYTDSRSLIR